MLELCGTSGRGTAKKSKLSKVIFRFQNRCMWAGEPFLPICSWRCYINLWVFLTLTCTAVLSLLTVPPLPPLTLLPVVLLLTPLSLGHTPPSLSLSSLLSHQVNLRAPGLGSLTRPFLKWEISEWELMGSFTHCHSTASSVSLPPQTKRWLKPISLWWREDTGRTCDGVTSLTASPWIRHNYQQLYSSVDCFISHST